MKMFGICLNQDLEFSVIGIANVNTRTVVFQSLLNEVPFFESEFYEDARDMIMNAAEINQPSKRKDVS